MFNARRMLPTKFRKLSADRTMERDSDLVEQEHFNIDEEIRAILVQGLDQVTWEPSSQGGTVSTIRDIRAELKAAIRSLASSLVKGEKVSAIRHEEGSGNIVRAEGPCSVTITECTHIVPIVLSGSPPTIGHLSLTMETITHVKQGKILVKPGSIVCFSFYSRAPEK
ncbi:unnamed protein product [Clonostachys rhizophaga]|uniref:Uncharacterized protein n=1 Tax=Clonostachys rhizophaga TaxID=160324 RepID=A0A9N9VCV8_9HYPO|nr:unnamed protein product [Clonostachys rhizophaga]